MTDKKTGDYYRKRASEYEEIYHRDDEARQGELAEEAKRLETLVTGKTVLELACGTGYWTEIMARSAQSIVAVDASPEMLEEARKKEYATYVTFVESDMFAYDGQDGMADVIALGFWFSHQPRQDYERFFDLLDRLLAPGGSIWMIDNNPPAESGSLHDHVRVDEFGNNYKFRLLSDGSKRTILKNYFSSNELRGIFEPRFDLTKLDYGYRYWSVQLAPIDVTH